MVKDFGFNENDIGYYCGFIASSFSLAQLMTAMWWGLLSDKIGRRPVLLIGLVGNSISTCCFGLSDSLLWAILARSACGLLNGNISVAKSVLGEITDRTNQGSAFALIGLNYGVGLIVGPALGGLLSHPVENMPALFADRGWITFLFIKYPYFLPCLISSIISSMGFVFGYFFLPETCAHLIKGYRPVAQSEEAALIWEDEEDVAYESPPNLMEFTQNSTAVDIPAALCDCNTEANDRDETIIGRIISSTKSIGLQAIASSLAYSLLAFQNIIFTEVFPLWAVSKPSSGLGFTAQDIGFLFSCLGVVAICCQIIIYPRASSIFTPLSLFKYPLIGLLLVFTLLPMISAYLAPSPLVWVALFLVMGLRSLLENVIFTSVMLLVSVFLCYPNLIYCFRSTIPLNLDSWGS